MYCGAVVNDAGQMLDRCLNILRTISTGFFLGPANGPRDDLRAAVLAHASRPSRRKFPPAVTVLSTTRMTVSLHDVPTYPACSTHKTVAGSVLEVCFLRLIL